MKQSQIPIAICIFVDGLNEIESRYDDLVSMIKDLANSKNVKICLSSRPLLVFEEAFNGTSGLKLQELTFDSIRAYVDGQLSHSIIQRAFYGELDRRRAEEIVRDVVQRADGVFLWTVIAVKEIRDGLQGMTNLNELARTVNSLPSELEGLFMLMLNRIKPACQRDAARFLQIALHNAPCASNCCSSDTPLLTLCSLYLIHAQQELEDEAFTYEKVPIIDMVHACKILKIQLLSHTAGLLELTPGSQRRAERAYMELRPSNEPLLNMNIHFLHGTVREFLSNNKEARLFLARKGFTKGQVHLAIARGRLTQLAQFRDEHNRADGRIVPLPAYFVFHNALQHISLAERHLGATQHKFMQSLSYGQFVNNYDVMKFATVIKGSYSSYSQAFIIDNAGSSIDVVGMAATVNMTLYVCERLGISAASKINAPDLPSLGDYCANTSTRAVWSWIGPSHVQNPCESVQLQLRSSDYRQTLCENLQLDPNFDMDSKSEQVLTHQGNDVRAETYLLSCCSTSCQDLIRILLHAGANPMAVVVGPVDTKARPGCFWKQWLTFLLDSRRKYMISNRGRSGGILLEYKCRDCDLTPKTVFEITKALLVRGADVNFPLKPANSTGYICYLKRRTLSGTRPDLIVKATAMFVLEECFNK